MRITEIRGGRGGEREREKVQVARLKTEGEEKRRGEEEDAANIYSNKTTFTDFLLFFRIKSLLSL